MSPFQGLGFDTFAVPRARALGFEMSPFQGSGFDTFAVPRARALGFVTSPFQGCSVYLTGGSGFLQAVWCSVSSSRTYARLRMLTGPER